MSHAACERHGRAKLTIAKVTHMRDTYAANRARIVEIDAQIADLKRERLSLKNRCNHKQMAFNFGVALVTINRVLDGTLWRHDETSLDSRKSR